MPRSRAITTLTELFAHLGPWGERSAIRALEDGGFGEWTYRELHDRAARFGTGLNRLGIVPQDHVVLMAPNRPEWIAVCLGTIAAGAVLVPLDSQLDKDSLTHVLQDCAPALIVTTARTGARLREVIAPAVPVYLLDVSPDDPQSWLSICAEAHSTLPEAAAERTAVMFYTSGTTGMPKGVPLSHRNLAFQVETLLDIDLVAEGDQILLALPLHHVYPFVAGMLGALAYGVTLVLPQALNGPQVLRALRDGRVTTVIGVPRLYEVLLSGLWERVRARGRVAVAFQVLLTTSIMCRRYLGLRVGRQLFRFLHRRLAPEARMFASGGAALDPGTAWTLEGLGWTVMTGYGLTETSPLIAIVPPGSTDFDSVGQPVPGIEVRIRPGAATAPSAPGEIQVRGPGVFAGYHNLPEKTAEAFTEDGWFRTEDLGHLDSAGRLHVFGRASTLIVTAAGENLLPEEIEEAYARDPAIREVGVLQRDRGLVAVVVPALGVLRQRGETDVDAAVRRAVNEAARSLPTYKRLADITISQDALPRTRLGKIRRAALQRRYDSLKAGRGVVGAVGPLPRAEMTEEDWELLDHRAAESVLEWLATRYPDRRLGPDSHTALDLGIDSLEWIDVTLEIQRLTGAEISEEATGRIETVRDLLIEVINATGRAPQSREMPPKGPEIFLNDRQRRWLAPLGLPGRICRRLLHGSIRLVVGRLFCLKVEGKEHLLPGDPFVLAPNHASVLDPFVLAAALDYDLLRDTYWAGWVGMAFANPLVRFVSRIAQVLPIEQDRAATSSLALGEAVLRQGKNLIWFPEGARTHSGRLQPFRLGIGLLLRRIAVPVVPVWIEGTFEAMPAGRRMPRLRQVRVTIGEAISAKALEERGRGETPEARLADALRDAVANLGPRSGGLQPQPSNGTPTR